MGGMYPHRLRRWLGRQVGFMSCQMLASTIKLSVEPSEAVFHHIGDMITEFGDMMLGLLPDTDTPRRHAATVPDHLGATTWMAWTNVSLVMRHSYVRAVRTWGEA